MAEKAELQSKLHQALKKIDKKQDECDEMSGRLKGNRNNFGFDLGKKMFIFNYAIFLSVSSKNHRARKAG